MTRNFNEADVLRSPHGRFAEQHKSEPSSVSLGAPTVGKDFVLAALIEDNEHYAGTTPAMLEEITERLNRSRNFTTSSIAETADAVWLETRGVTAEDEHGYRQAVAALREHGKDAEARQLQTYVEALRAKAEASGKRDESQLPVADGITGPVPADDPRLHAGEVFDRIMAEGAEFQRSEVIGYPQDTQAIRLQASRPLTDEEAYQLSGVIGYANMSAVGGEPLDDPAVGPSRDTAYSFISHIDTNKGKQGDFDKFEAMVDSIVTNGSAPRKSNRNGPIGSRAIEPFGDKDLTFEIYYQA